MESSPSRTVALARTAARIGNNMSERATDSETRLSGLSVQLIGQLPKFMDGIKRLDQANSAAARKDALAKVIPYNHTLRDIADAFPGTSVRQLRAFCAYAARDLLEPNDLKPCDEATFETIRGMQQEIGLELILGQIEGVEDIKKATTIEQESRGIDVSFTYYGVPIELDAKSSQFGEAAALKKRDVYMAQNGIHSDADVQGGYPVFTGIDYEEFNGGFRVNQKTIDRCMPHIEKVITYLANQKSQHTKQPQLV